MENKENNKNATVVYNKVMYAIIAFSLLAIFYLNFVAGNTGTGRTYSSSSYSNSASNSYTQNISLAKISNIPVSTTIQKNGEFYVITTRVRNNTGYSLNEKLKVYIEDSTGIKKFVDMVYVQLEAGEAGVVNSKISTSDAGPSPHTITTEWE